MKLYGRWTAKSFTVTLNPDGGALPDSADSSIQISYGAAYSTIGSSLVTPTRTGYTFEDWYTEANGKGDKIESSSTKTYDKTTNQTLYALDPPEIHAYLSVCFPHIRRMEGPGRQLSPNTQSPHNPE